MPLWFNRIAKSLDPFALHRHDLVHDAVAALEAVCVQENAAASYLLEHVGPVRSEI